jgi:hypothetical protein
VDGERAPEAPDRQTDHRGAKLTTVNEQRAAIGQDDDEEAVLLDKLSGWLRSRYSVASPSESEPSDGEGDHNYGELDEESFYSAVELQRSLFDAISLRSEFLACHANLSVRRHRIDSELARHS